MQQKIKLKGKRVAVEKLKARQKGMNDLGLVLPDSEEYLGIIMYVSDEADQSLKPGQKVYFSTNYQPSRISGKELCIMNDTEIFAVVED